MEVHQTLTRPLHAPGPGKEQPNVSTTGSPSPGLHLPSTGSRLTSWGGFVLIAVVTTLAALLEVSLTGEVSWLSGGALTVISAFVAFAIRRQDLSTAIISPPLAYLLAVIISAQVAVVGASGSFWLLEATTILSGLAFNAQWVFLATGVAAGIVLLRRLALRRGDATPSHGA